MKRILLLMAAIVSVLQGSGQSIKPMKAQDIMHFAGSSDTVYIINFWATWCAPCVQELPEFNDLYKGFEGKAVKILMVSLDFKQDYPMKLQAFVERKRLLPQVAWLSDTDPNVFIPKIEDAWEGSIPATLIVKPGTGKRFIEGQVSARQVAKVIDGMLAEN